MSLTVLGTEQDDQWRDWIWELPTELRDIHWHPDLYRAYELIYGYKACLVVSTEGSQYALQPCLIGPSDSLHHVFNFGGPVGSHCVGLSWDLVDWKRKEGITHERCTLHPLVSSNQLAILAKSPCSPEHVKDAVYVDLTKPIELRETHRHMVRKAREAKVSLVIAIPDSRNLQIFNDMYQGSMARKNAAEHWKFPDSYFPIMRECLGDKLTLFFAYAGRGELESACILIHDNDAAYYHYAASVGKHSKLGVGHAMVMACADWARAVGYKKLFLGGGVEPEDGLFLFKSGFSKDRAPVYRYEVIT